MNINLPLDPRPAPASKVDGVGTADRAASREANGPSPAAPAASEAAADRVEISAEARAKASTALPTDAASLEVEVARVALRANSELSPAKLHELRERIRTGYYDQPKSIDRIAEAAARDLAE